MNAVLEVRADQIDFIVDSEWKCPECGHDEVKLYVHPHKCSGVFECQADDCGASWSCEHEETEAEEIEVDTMRNGEHDTYKTIAYDCKLCGTDVTELLT